MNHCGPLWHRRQVLVAGLASGVALALPGCAQPPIKVGFLGNLTGPGAEYGIAGRDGAQLAIEHANAAGGLDGAMFEQVAFDDRQQPEAIDGLLKTINAAGLIGMIGPMLSGVARAWIPLANAQRLLTISPTAASTEFSGLDDYFFRISSTAKDYAYASAEHHIRQRNWHRIAVVRDDSNAAYTQNWTRYYRLRVQELGGQVLAEVAYRLTEQAQNLAPYIEQALALQPDALVLVSNSVDSARIVQWLHKNGHTVPIALDGWGATDLFLEQGARAAEGVESMMSFDINNQSSRYLAFKSAFTQRFQREPGLADVAGYEATEVMLTAYAERMANETLRSALLRLRRFNGLQNTIEFDTFGDAQQPLFVVQVRNGQFVVVGA